MSFGKFRVNLALLLMAILVCGLSGRAYAQKVWGLYDPNFDKTTGHFQRVAIIPNRLPLTLQEPEKWRRYNWKQMARAFTSLGYEVVNYEQTMRATLESALPLEDTGASEEKFNACARMLDVDLIILPYYSTAFDFQDVLLFFQKSRFISTVSLQFYSRHHNMFFLRSDSSRRYTVDSVVQFLGGLLMTWGFYEEQRYDPQKNATYYESNDKVAGCIGAGLMLAGTIKSMSSAERWWKKAFNSAIKFSLHPFFAVYPEPNVVR